MKYDKELENEIISKIDERYAEFHAGLVPGQKIRGVRIPELRKIAKKFSVYDDFLFNVTLDNYESISVACYYIGYKAKDLYALEKYTDFILPYVDNWAVCDTFVSSLKILHKSKAGFLPTVLKYLDSDNDFTVRFAIVCGLNYYVEDNADIFFNKFSEIQGRDYYIDMAIAWFVSVAFIKCREKTLEYLNNKKLTPFVLNKSISKICDSYRVRAEDKDYLRGMRV
ncbi:MAG: DNA alkylation repair protein [Clostridia bacterium]|nr:DNA alkylation repair protein [Clostridia bacterium]